MRGLMYLVFFAVSVNFITALPSVEEYLEGDAVNDVKTAEVKEMPEARIVRAVEKPTKDSTCGKHGDKVSNVKF